LTKAKEYFEKAIDQDPGYALAHTGFGDCYAVLAVYDLLPPHECWPKAKAALLRALEIDPNLGAAHASFGTADLWYNWDTSAAERKLIKAIELNPEYASAHQWYGMCLAVMGRLSQAWAEMNRANDLDPLSRSINYTRVWVRYWERRFEEAISLYRQVVFDHADFWAAHYYLGLSLLQGGQTAEAVTELERARSLSDNPWRLSGLTYAYARAGRLAEARETLEELLEVSKQRYVSPSRIAVAYVGLGEKDQAFEWLEKALADRCYDLMLSGMEPLFDPIRSDPRFGDLRKRIVPA
jgi:tetratricopeptide (TPR) repeat protein